MDTAENIASIAVEGGIVRLVTSEGETHRLVAGDSAGRWILRWLGGTDEDPRAVLETTTTDGGTFVSWSQRDGTRIVVKPRPGGYQNPPGATLYGGHTLEEVLASARDLLGDEVQAAGEPSYEAVVGLLPPVRRDRYQILGSPLSRGKYIVWPDGTVTTQDDAPQRVVFQPARLDARVAQCDVHDGLLDDWMPIACYRFEGEDSAYELVALVKPEAYEVEPRALFRLTRCAKPGYTPEETHVLQVPPDPTWVGESFSEADFYAALDGAVRFWWDFESQMTPVDLPEARAWRWTKGCLALATTMFCGDHPKYGGFHYAAECHDTFPPTVLTLAETAMAWGLTDQAAGYLEYYLAKIVRPDGSFNYYGPSATEYGQWLWLLNEFERQHGAQAWIARNLEKIIKTGRLVEELREPVGNPSLRLIRLGAEADNRHERYFYFSNSLWAARGLACLGDLVERHGQPKAARQAWEWANSLARDVTAAVAAYTEETDVGPLLPSFIGYPADMWTLSLGPALPEEVPEEEQEAFTVAQKYVPEGYLWEEDAPRQWIRENTYANYRYHPEALSAMNLDEAHAEGLVRLREERGGSLLGMTRFMGWLDDWPVAAYARYLLSTDRIDDYLLLYYSHMAHHGNRETLTYYEQVSADGEVKAHDCVPCLLVTPIMTRWMVCFEPLGEAGVYLLRGIPRAWLAEGQEVSARGLPTSVGPINVAVRVSRKRVEVRLGLPPVPERTPVYVDLRLPEDRRMGLVETGEEWVAEVRTEAGYRLVIAPGKGGEARIVIRIED
jgi:hypothetical protein